VYVAAFPPGSPSNAPYTVSFAVPKDSPSFESLPFAVAYCAASETKGLTARVGEIVPLTSAPQIVPLLEQNTTFEPPPAVQSEEVLPSVTAAIPPSAVFAAGSPETIVGVKTTGFVNAFDPVKSLFELRDGNTMS
jgi:hypothetical protein